MPLPSEERPGIPEAQPTLADRLFPSPMVHPDIIRVGWMADNRLHNFLVVLYHLARIPLPLCALLVALILAPGALAHELALAAWGLLALVAAGDLTLLLLLPRMGVSFGWPGPPWLLYSLGRSALAALTGLIPLAGAWELLPLALVQLTLTALSLYGSLVEPFWLENTRLTWKIRGLKAPLKLLLISDLHLERPTRREPAVLAAIERGRPDLIVFAGDLFNLSYVGDPDTLRDVQAFLSRLKAPAGVFFTRGTWEIDPPELAARALEGTEVRLVENELVTVTHGDARLHLVGIPAEGSREEREATLRELLPEEERPVVVVHHLPELMVAAADLEADVYLAGHTHGGQICVPLLGPVATGSRLARRYVKGYHRLGRTRAYISRGVGLEGLGAPRMRFLARPELVWLDLEPEGEG